MVNYEDRIAAMAAAGQISPDQASDMINSVKDVTRKVAVTYNRRRMPVTGVVAATLVIGLAAYILFGGDSAPQMETIQHVDTILNNPNEVGTMNHGTTKTISVIVLLLPLVASLLAFMGFYNGLVDREEAVFSSWSQVESNYQRRADLIPGLVSAVRSYMKHESEVVGNVLASRSPDNLEAALQALEESQKVADGDLKKAQGTSAEQALQDDAVLMQISASQKNVGNQLTKVMGLVEAYPNLRSADNVLTLQDQLEGSENRINAARMVFNETVQDYNASIRRMPGSLVAGFGNFKRKAYFESDKGAEKVVPVNLD